jgi:hypothetical protein
MDHLQPQFSHVMASGHTQAPGAASPAARASGKVWCESAQFLPQGGPSKVVWYSLKGTLLVVSQWLISMDNLVMV